MMEEEGLEIVEFREEGEENGDGESLELWKKVFGNELVLERLTSYLQLGDLKVVRQVSPLTASKVSSLGQFLKWTVLKVSLRTPNDVAQKLRETQVCWENVWFWAGQCPSDADFLMETLSPLLPTVKNLKFSVFGDIEAIREDEVTRIEKGIQMILSNCPELKVLQIEDQLLEKVLLCPHNRYKETLEIFSKLKEFRVLSLDRSKGIDTNEVFGDNVKFLASALTQLKTLHAGDFTTDLFQESYSIFQCMAQLVNRNASSLTKLELINLKFWRENLLSLDLTCPYLKSFKARVRTLDCAPVAQFLGMQPLLEDIGISVKGILMSPLFEVIKERSRALVSLDVKARALEETTGIRGNPWNFLEDLGKLTRFSLVIPNCMERVLRIRTLGFYQDILSALPSTLTSLNLRGVQGRGPVDLDALSLRNPLIHTLRLERCKGIVNNTSIHFLTTPSLNEQLPFPNLTHLHLSHCSGLTDLALTGGSTLAVRKGLQSLSLQFCGLTDACVSGLKFQELIRLDLSGNKMSVEGMRAVVEENPSLEYLRSSVRGVSRHHQRLSRITYKNLEAEGDSDSDADNGELEEREERERLQAPPRDPTYFRGFYRPHNAPSPPPLEYEP